MGLGIGAELPEGYDQIVAGILDPPSQPLHCRDQLGGRHHGITAQLARHRAGVVVGADAFHVAATAVAADGAHDASVGM